MNKEATRFIGKNILSDPQFNKGTAFSLDERHFYKLHGLLPNRIETLEEQIIRVKYQYEKRPTPLDKNLFLNDIYHENATLFFALVSQNLKEMLPIIYTPTIGDAVINFSKNYKTPTGLIISYPQIGQIEAILDAIDPKKLEIAVVTDGEGVLGIGDQGVGGLNIAIGKLMVYTLCGAINPFKTLPIQLDMGTNNEELLNDPLYLGWRHKRVTGDKYYEFMDHFTKAFSTRFPTAFLHWEDFGRDNARAVLDRYRTAHPSFNDDIQGTGVVALAAILSGIKQSGLAIEKHKFCIFGAGTAGVGIADQISKALSILENTPESEIRKRFYLIDRNGLICENKPENLFFQEPYAKTASETNSWQNCDKTKIGLLDVLKNARPTVLIGSSTVSGAFTEEIIKTMYSYQTKPIILPLSNPTSKAECTPENIMKWTDGNGLVATGSPFGEIKVGDKTFEISQCNNALAFPGIGLGMLISKAQTLSDGMLLAASKALAEIGNSEPVSSRLLPDFSNAVKISQAVALAVAEHASAEGLSKVTDKAKLAERAKNFFWAPEYREYLPEETRI